MKVRGAIKDDASSLCTLVISLSHFYLENDQDELPSWFRETLTQEAFLNRIESDDYHNFVYEDQGKVIGYLSMKGNRHLYHLFVSEPYQGKGISRQLWNHVMIECVSDIYTLRSSLFAVPVYKRFGFKVSGDAEEKEGIGFQPMELSL